MDMVENMDVTQIAGFGGNHRSVRWVHMVETTEASDFLDGGEIAFITGLGINGGATLLDLAKAIQSKNAAGMIVNTGPFIESVPQEVTDFCNENEFPLFVIPWRIHLAEVMRIFCFEITKDQQHSAETSAAFENAIFFPEQEELYIVPLSQQGFHADWNYSVCLICLENSAADLTRRLDQLCVSIDVYIRHKYNKFAAFCHDDEIIIVAADYSEEELRELINDIHSHALRTLANGESITMGCGRLTKSIRCLNKSYDQARSIQQLQKNGKVDPSLFFFPDMGLYQILMSIEDRNILNEFCGRTIDDLFRYDEKNNSDLTTVLHSYLTNNGSVKETAAGLYVHRNTINYKLNKISEILDMDLSSLNNRMKLTVAFMLKDML